MLLRSPPARATTTRGRAVDGYWLQRRDGWFCAWFPRKAHAVYVAGGIQPIVAAADAGAASIVVA